MGKSMYESENDFGIERAPFGDLIVGVFSEIDLRNGMISARMGDDVGDGDFVVSFTIRDVVLASTFHASLSTDHVIERLDQINDDRLAAGHAGLHAADVFAVIRHVESIIDRVRRTVFVTSDAIVIRNKEVL